MKSFLTICLLFLLALSKFAHGSEVQAVNNESIIIQFLPEISVSRFLSAYPSLQHRMMGNITIGSFKAVYGKFDKRFVQLLSYSSLVCFKKIYLQEEEEEGTNRDIGC